MKLDYQVDTFCNIASARTGAHICGWFNFSFNALYIALQVKKLAQIKNLADVAFHRRQHHWNTYDYSKDCLKQFTDTLEIQNCQKSLLENLEDMKDEIQYIETDIVPAFYWSTLVPFFVLLLAIFWLTQLESKNARLVRAICWTFVTAVTVQLFIQIVFLIFIHSALRNHIDCGSGLATATRFGSNTPEKIEKYALQCKNMRSIPWQLWFTYIIYAGCNFYLMPLILNYTRERITWLNGREDDLVSHASGIFFEDNTNGMGGSQGSGGQDNRTSNLPGARNYSEDESSVTSETALDRMGRGEIKNRKSSFRIEDDPFGDNFRASLEDIRTGTRSHAPRTPNLSRYSSRNSHDAIKEQPDLEAASASSFSNVDGRSQN